MWKLSTTANHRTAPTHSPNAANVGFKPTHDWTILLYQFFQDYSIEKSTLQTGH